MTSSSSTISVFDAHRFRTAHNEQLFYSYARRRKVVPEVGFNLEDDEYPEIMEQIALRGWRRLAAPRTDISKLLVQEFYANAAVSDEEAAAQEELPYKSFVRGKEIDFSPNNIRKVMRFNRETAGALTDYKTHQAMNQRLDEKSQADYMEEVKQIKEKQEQIYNHNQKFHAQVWKEQEKLAKEIQDIRRGQMTQVAANNQRFEAKRNLQLALERQGRDIAEIRKQVNLWTNNVSSKEAYACWAQQQANPNLNEVPITQISDIMRTNVEKGRPLFHGFLKSDYGASSSSQVDPEEPVPLWTTPPSPHFHPPHPPSN
ncbi:hypothetical protein PIB30_089870 [Stylosanthes scabra]|uniref:Putative plant transposon protein domain-containing protein n=1 Tax=Stylosanthes scabra TaxID=79078 RepID=A0ABU6XTH0_9FABA|nr:hypothetical protein [Stylosanthes scabra]